MRFIKYYNHYLYYLLIGISLMSKRIGYSNHLNPKFNFEPIFSVIESNNVMQ